MSMKFSMEGVYQGVGNGPCSRQVGMGEVCTKDKEAGRKYRHVIALWNSIIH